MLIENAKYFKNEDGVRTSISATVDGKQTSVPIDSTNRHYVEMMEQVEKGTLTIKDAD
tara:strand:+ start:293 stop:466 length:174 start_codon:yes stop_codon:yes gene_type:complete